MDDNKIIIENIYGRQSEKIKRKIDKIREEIAGLTADELETLNKPEDAGKVDALIELKLRIMEEIHKDTELKRTLNLLME